MHMRCGMSNDMYDTFGGPPLEEFWRTIQIFVLALGMHAASQD